MIGSLFFVFAVKLLSLAALAAGDEDDYKCPYWQVDIDTSKKGTLASPKYYDDDEYPPNLDCWWQLNAPEGHRIKLTFQDFDLDVSATCQEDGLAIKEKDDTEVGTFCGSELPRPVLSHGNAIKLHFYTDFMQGGRGFLIQYESGPDMQLCDYGYEVCRNRNCYNPQKACDGVDDCGDGTDEQDCGFTPVDNPSDCGIPAISPRTNSEFDRMVGGEEAIPNSWPWQVSLQLPSYEPNGHFCGGTLINTLWVLTASHCVAGMANPGDIRIVLGLHGKFTKTAYHQVRYSAKVISYPELLGDDILNYNILNDVSLIRLSAPVILSKGVHPACLPKPEQNIEIGWSCYGTGWGESRGTGSAFYLKQTVQEAWPKYKCYVNNPEGQVCTGNTRIYACSGDSGGPLNCKIGGRWYVSAAASTVITQGLNKKWYPDNKDSKTVCAGNLAFTTYATTANKYQWILKMIKKYSQDY